MGSTTRRVKKNAAKLRLLKGGKSEGEPVMAEDFDEPSRFLDQLPHLGGCVHAREEYELEDVVCCKTCHRREDFSRVEDRHGHYMVCCNIRQKLCPSEGGPQHPGAA